MASQVIGGVGVKVAGISIDTSGLVGMLDRILAGLGQVPTTLEEAAREMKDSVQWSPLSDTGGGPGSENLADSWDYKVLSETEAVVVNTAWYSRFVFDGTGEGKPGPNTPNPPKFGYDASAYSNAVMRTVFEEI